MAKGRVFYVPGHGQTQNADLLIDFIQYCWNHPHERFWQALRNWAGVNFIWVSERRYDDWRYYESLHKFTEEIRDTFYWRGKNG